jgi:hypothetical protein
LLTSYWSFEKEYITDSHYNTLHKEKYDKGATRLAMLYDLKSKISKQKSLFLKLATNERENLTALYDVCLQLVKHKKDFQRQRINQMSCNKNGKCFQ